MILCVDLLETKVMGLHENNQAIWDANNGFGPPGSHDKDAYEAYWRQKTCNDYLKNTTTVPGSSPYQQPEPYVYPSQTPHVELTIEQRAELVRKRAEEEKINAEKRRIWYRTFFRRTGMFFSLSLGTIIAGLSFFGLAFWASKLSRILKHNPHDIWVAPAIVALGFIVSVILFSFL